VRQFRNMKGSVALDAIDPRALADYAGICGQLLAKGHARTSGASMIAGYLGRSGKGRPRPVRARPRIRRPDRTRPPAARRRSSAGAVPCEPGV
jgi:hypothetical protein